MAENVKESAKGGAVDQVLAVSRHPDGSPAQTPGFKSVNPEFTAAVSEQQLREQAVSAVDDEIRSARLKAAAGEVVDDPAIKELRAAHEKAANAAVSRAKSEKVEG